MKLLVYSFVLSFARIECKETDPEKNLPTVCHVCKHTIDEFLNELSTSNSKDILNLGHVLQPEERQKTIVYKKSELRLIEALENTCKNLKNYKVHKDKHKHLRYSKDESATFRTLNELRERGVKVDLGFPDEMWDTPDAEIVTLKAQCEIMLEKYEDDITEWYYDHQEKNLHYWLCRERVLNDNGENKDCLQDLSGEKSSKIENDKVTNAKEYERKDELKTDKNSMRHKTSGKNNEFKDGNEDVGLKKNGDELTRHLYEL